MANKELSLITVEIVYASETTHELLVCKVPVNTTIKEAITNSGILELFPELKCQLDQEELKVGIFSRLKKLTDSLSHSDRVEIYRPLLIDPKEARRVRAKT